MTEHMETRKKLKEIPSLKTFNELLNACTLNETDKEIIKLKYIDELNFIQIGERVGYSEQTVRKRHRKALNKLSKIL